VRSERPVICPKCHRAAWAPYKMQVTKKYGQTYVYLVFRHPDGRRHTPRKCTIRVQEGT
jgi:hypothetical protein